MVDIGGELKGVAGQVTGKGVQLADLLKPDMLGLWTGNPHTLAEWFIYILLLPITLPLTWAMMCIRWILVESAFVENQIMKMVGVDRTRGIGEALQRCAGGGVPILSPIIDALIAPSNEFDLGIMESAASAVTSQGLDYVLNPLMRPIGFCMERIMENNIIDATKAAVLVHKGFLDEGTAADIAGAYGYGSGAFQMLVDDTKEAPDVMSALTLVNRGFMDQGAAYEWFRIAGLDADAAQQLINLRWFVPSVGEIQGYIAGYGYSFDRIGQFGLMQEYPNAANADLAKNGANEDAGMKAWVAHWNLPNNGLLIDAYHRRMLSKEELYAAFAVNGTPPVMRDLLVNQGVTLPMRRQINMMYKYGVIDQNYAHDIFLRYGFSPDDANKLTLLAAKQVNPYEAGNLAGDATEAYIDDTITYGTAKQYLIQSGHSDFEATLHLAGATHKKGVNVLKTVEQFVKQAYINGDMSLDEAQNYVLQYGETAERAAVLKELWLEEQKHTVKHVSEADARSAYQIGLVNASQLRVFLEALHYAEDDISVIIALENATMQKPQSNVIAPITTSSGRAKSFTKAELKKMYIDGIISSDTWWTEMLSLGYTDAQVQAYAELMIGEATTATGS